jgi:hypothetical protein
MRFELGSLFARHGWRAPRRDGTSLAFGLSFLAFGAAGIARAAGVHVGMGGVYPLLLLALGGAGLIGVLQERFALKAGSRDRR